METTVLDILVLAAFALLVVVTGGIGYLTASQWRDRRRQDQEKRAARTARTAKPARTGRSKPDNSAKPAKPTKQAKQAKTTKKGSREVEK